MKTPRKPGEIISAVIRNLWRLSAIQGRAIEIASLLFSEGPEYEENRSWLEGKYPKETGRAIFHLYHMYENEEGVQHHWFEIYEFLPVLSELIKMFNIEVIVSNQLTVVQVLWD